MYSLSWFKDPGTFRRLVNLWPPLWGAGISVRTISDDWMHARLRLVLRFYNRNFVGTQFGGSLFAMSDMMYMLMLLHHIGRDHTVWDSSAEIKFLKPGRGNVYADFDLDQSRIDDIVAKAADGEKHFEPFVVRIYDEDKVLIAEVTRTIYVRRKPAKTASPGNDRAEPSSEHHQRPGVDRR